MKQSQGASKLVTKVRCVLSWESRLKPSQGVKRFVAIFAIFAFAYTGTALFFWANKHGMIIGCYIW